MITPLASLRPLRRARPAALALASLLLLVLPVSAQSDATGTLAGRVFNETSGNYLTNARIAVAGTALVAFTNELGEYQLTGVPAGEVQLAVTFTGLQGQSAPVRVSAGGVATRDFTLTRAAAPGTEAVVKLQEFVVASSREMNAADIAINEQRYAPNIRNVVDADAYGDAGEGNLGEFHQVHPRRDRELLVVRRPLHLDPRPALERDPIHSSTATAWRAPRRRA
jgi:iron complex outermembrane receptor protein